MKAKERDYFHMPSLVATVINASLDMTTVLEEVVKSVVEAMGLKASSIRPLPSSDSACVNRADGWRRP